MEIKEHRLLAFIELYKELHGITLSRKEAYAKASLLLHYVMLSIRPLAEIDDDDKINMPD